MLYQSLKLTNGIWVLAELRIQPGNPSFTVRRPLPPKAPGPLPSCPHACPGWGRPWWGGVGWGIHPGVKKHQDSDLRKLQLSPIKCLR